LVLGAVAERVILTAEQERADLVVLAPRRRRGWAALFNAGITERVTRLSPCPVLSITPLQPSRQWRGKLVPLAIGWTRPSIESV
jgi:hypothetical protein